MVSYGYCSECEKEWYRSMLLDGACPKCRRGNPYLLKAKYRGFCRRCSLPIEVGENIAYPPGPYVKYQRTYHHLDCSDTPDGGWEHVDDPNDPELELGRYD